MLGYYQRTDLSQTWHMSRHSGITRDVPEPMCDYGGAFCSPASIKWTGVMTGTALEILKFMEDTAEAPRTRSCRSCCKVLEDSVSVVDRLAEIA
jgi:hypothetical protein